MRTKLLDDDTKEQLQGDVTFIRKMLNTRNITVHDLSAVIRHLDMMKMDLQRIIANAQQKKK